jgi:hypothetical protein
MSWNICRNLFTVALVAILAVVSAGQSMALPITSAIALGPTVGPPATFGNFTATLSGGAGSQLTIGSVAGNYKAHIVVSIFSTNSNISVAAGSQTKALTIGSATLNTSNATGLANLLYDNHTPGTPEILNSLSATDPASSAETISASGVNFTVNGGGVSANLAFNGTLSNVSFASSGSATPAAYGSPGIPGTYSATISGTVTGTVPISITLPSPFGTINLGSVSLGTLDTLTPATISFPGNLPGNIALSDTGIPHGANPTPANPNNMLAAFTAALGSIPNVSLPVTIPINVNETNSIGSTSSGFTTLVITGSSLQANLNLSGVSYNLSGVVPNALIPEPSSLVLCGLALVGFAGYALKRRKAA